MSEGGTSVPEPGLAPAGPVPARPGLPLWLKGVGPLLLLGLLLAVFVRVGPAGVFRPAVPPVEDLTIERIMLPRPGEMRVRVTNGGPAPVTIAQVMVDEANWAHQLDGSRTLGRLETRTVAIPYPWVEGEPHRVTLVSGTGLTFSAEVPITTRTPAPDARYLTTFALLGVYAGVIPVFLGLLWFPFLRGISRTWLDFFLSLTLGLLVFLGVDALVEALEFAGQVPAAYQGVGLVVLGLAGAPLAVAALSAWQARTGAGRSAWYVASLIAGAIGLHNLGEGLAIGTAYAAGEVALGTFLVVGFLLHNTTEGLGIVAPLAGTPVAAGRLLGLGLLAGGPYATGVLVPV